MSVRHPAHVEMEGLSVLNQQTYHRVIWERRIMFMATALCVFCIALFVIAVATASWAVFDVYDEKSNVTVCLHVGIWGEWRIEADPVTKEVRKSKVMFYILPGIGSKKITISNQNPTRSKKPHCVLNRHG